MPVETPCPADHPLMLAWKAYQETANFKSTEEWAKKPLQFFDDSDIPEPARGANKFSKRNMEMAIEGSLWACFMNGFAAAGGKTAV